MHSSKFLATEKTAMMMYNAVVDQSLVYVIDSAVVNSFTELPNSYENTLNLPKKSVLKDQPQTVKYTKSRKILTLILTLNMRKTKNNRKNR